MFWIFILVTALGFILVKLGALSVMVTALSVVLYFALLVIVGLVITLLWKKLFGTKNGTRLDNDANRIQRNG